MPTAEEGAEEATQGQAMERARPQGLPAEAFESHVFEVGEGGCLALAREDAIQGFLKGIPPALAGLWDLAPSPLALFPFLRSGSPASAWAALVGESDSLHILFFRGDDFLAYAKLFSGWEDAGRDAAAYARELKKALVYHFGGRFAAEALTLLRIGRDGPGGEIASSLKGLGIPMSGPDWGILSGIPPDFRLAAALAWSGREQEAASFSGSSPAAALAERGWMLRAGKLARYGVPALGALALAVALLGAAALGLRWTVEAKAKSWSGELRRWDEFQRRRSTVEAELNGMQGLLSRRTAVYADLQRIAPRLPAETWLEAWEAECSGSRCQYRLEGFAASEARVPEFLSALGRSGATGPLRLKATEKIKAEAVEQKTGIAANRRELVRFQLGSAP
jgi:Tfp pilus assembly protein PilN